MSEVVCCPACGAWLPADAPMSLCAPCLLGSCVSAQPSSSIQFAGYELLDAGKEGGMGIVYRARQINLDRIVALKMIRGAFLTAPAQVQRFRAEAESAASLDHPHIVPIYEIGEQDGRHFFTMKWLEGGSLADALHSGTSDREQAPPEIKNQQTKIKNPSTAAHLVATVARAVHHAHQRGIIHRDLKPSNILLDAAGQPHVSDFGLAKRLDSSVALTLTDQTLGTPAYMAPEQAAGKARDVTTAADIYSLGAILYELLTSQTPFAAPTPAAIMQKALTEEPIRPSSFSPKLPRDLETICLKCLEKDPHLRYSTAEFLAYDLDHWLRDEPISAQRSSLLGRTRKWARRNPAFATLLAAFLLVTVLGGGGTVWQSRKNQRSRDQRREVTETLKDLLKSLDPSLDESAQRSAQEGVVKRISNGFADQPAMRFELYGWVLRSWTNYPEARVTFLAALEHYRKQGADPGEEIAAELKRLDHIVQEKAQTQPLPPFPPDFEKRNWYRFAHSPPETTNICCYDPGLGTLPTDQGFTLNDSGRERRPKIVRGTLRMPGNPKIGGYQFWFTTNHLFDFSSNAYAIDTTLRVISAEDMLVDVNCRGFQIEAIDSAGYQVRVTIGTNTVNLAGNCPLTNVVVNTSAGFHTYRLVLANGGVGLFIDATLVASSPIIGPPAQPNKQYFHRVCFGDGSGWATSEVDLRAFRFEVFSSDQPRATSR